MYVLRPIFCILLLFTGAILHAADLNTCLTTAAYREHRLEKEADVRKCFADFKSKLTRENCYRHADRSAGFIRSTQLLSELTSVCFYEVGAFKTIKDCLGETKKFKNADQHDEAVFYCYQIFQDSLSKKQCMETADIMIFPAKKNYLNRHCMEN